MKPTVSDHYHIHVHVLEKAFTVTNFCKSIVFGQKQYWKRFRRLSEVTCKLPWINSMQIQFDSSYWRNHVSLIRHRSCNLLSRNLSIVTVQVESHLRFCKCLRKFSFVQSPGSGKTRAKNEEIGEVIKPVQNRICTVSFNRWVLLTFLGSK